MQLKFLLKTIITVLLVMLTGCDRDESVENSTLGEVSLSFVHEAIANAQEKNFQKENLPIWLTEFISNLKPNNYRDVAAFQAKWKGEHVYYIYDGYSSCLLCNTFKSDGEKFDASDSNFFEFWNSTPDWEIIYLNKSKIHDL